MTAPKVSAKVELDISQFENAVNQVLARSAAADKALGDIGGAIDIKLNIDDSSLNALKGQVADFSTVDLKLNVEDSEIRTAMSAVEDKSAKVKIDAQDNTDSTLKSIETKLTRLQQFATIELILDAAAFVSTFESLPIISTLADIDKQTDLVIGRTGRDLGNAGEVIRNVYNNAWGESREEIANAIVELATVKNLNDEFVVSAENLERVVTGAYEAAAVGGEDVNMVIRAATNLVNTGLVDSFDEAFDFIAFGFQKGLNQGDDFLDTLIEYSQQFRDAELGAEGFFNLLATATQAGNFNTDKAADAFKEFFNLVQEEVSDFDLQGTLTDRVKQLESLDLLDEAQAFSAGELSGQEFAEAVLAEIEKIPDEAQKLLAVKQIFGPTQVEETGKAFFGALDLAKGLDWEGTAAAGAAIINDNLSTALAEASRTFEDAMVIALNNALNISEFLDKVTGAATTFADSIQAGMSIGQALEISLALPEGSFATFESSIGNFAIGVLEFIAGIQEFFGHGDVAAGTRGTISRLAERQLAFDLQLADVDDLAGIVQTALDRGVKGVDVQAAFAAGIDDLVASGKIEEAFAVIQELASADGGALGFLNEDALRAQVDSALKVVFEEYQAAVAAGDLNLAQAIGESLGRSDIDTAKEVASQQLGSFLQDTFTTATGVFDPITATDLVDLPTMQTEFMTAGEQIKIANDGMINSAADLERQIGETVTVSVANVQILETEGGTAVRGFTEDWQAMSGAILDTVTNLAEPLSGFIGPLMTFKDLATASVQLGGAIGAQGGVTPGNTPIPTFAEGGVTPAGSPFMWGEQPEIMSLNEQAAVLNTQTSQAVISGLQALFGGMMPGGGTFNNQRNMNQYITVNTQSPAQDANAVYTMNNSLRGFS